MPRAMNMRQFFATVHSELGSTLAAHGLARARDGVYRGRREGEDWLVLHLQSYGLPLDPLLGADLTFTILQSPNGDAGVGPRARLGAFLTDGAREAVRARRNTLLDLHRPGPILGSDSTAELMRGAVASRYDVEAPLPPDVWLPFWNEPELTTWLHWLREGPWTGDRGGTGGAESDGEQPRRPSRHSGLASHCDSHATC